MLLPTLERLDPLDDQAFGDVLALETATRAVDWPEDPPPTPRAARAFRRFGWDGEPGEEWLCRDPDGQLVGKLGLRLPRRDNQHVVFCAVLVHPAHRRRGLGRQLAARLPELAAQPGRRVLIGTSRDTEAAAAFATGLGFTQAIVDVMRRQELPAVDWPRVEKLHAEAEAASRDYQLLRLTGPVPEELIEEVAVMEAAINDAPLDDLAMADEVIDPERIRAREHSIGQAGLREYRLIARRTRDNRLAGHTIVHIDPEQPQHGWQGDTSVLPAHRGHRLGLRLKAEMMRWLVTAEPQLRWVDTGNAESNRHMISINEALGYQLKGRQLGWQKDL